MFWFGLGFFLLAKGKQFMASLRFPSTLDNEVEASPWPGDESCKEAGHRTGWGAETFLPQLCDSLRAEVAQCSSGADKYRLRLAHLTCKEALVGPHKRPWDARGLQPKLIWEEIWHRISIDWPNLNWLHLILHQSRSVLDQVPLFFSSISVHRISVLFMGLDQFLITYCGLCIMSVPSLP